MQDEVMRSMVSGVYVVTAQNQGKLNGATVTWATQVSFDPLLVMVALADVRVTHGLIKKSGYFGINVLGSEQLETARHFGFKTARDVDKMAGVTYTTNGKRCAGAGRLPGFHRLPGDRFLPGR